MREIKTLRQKALTAIGFLVFICTTFAFTKLSKAIDEPGNPIASPKEMGGGTNGTVEANSGTTWIKLEFDAQTPGPEGIVGYSDSMGISFEGKVDTCYSQSGNKAVFAGTITKGRLVPHSYFIVEVEDNSDKGIFDTQAQTEVKSEDLVEVSFSATPPLCNESDTLLNATVKKGNLVVHTN